MTDDRFSSRTEALIGVDAAAKLAAASVAVFGVGGVGSYVAEALARAGVGRLILVDGDRVSLSNCNRQLCALSSTVGRPKAQVMAERCADIQPGIAVEWHELFYLPPTGAGLAAGCDYVADAVDMPDAKVALALECRDAGVPLISAMGCGNKLDPMGFRVADIYSTKICPLCRRMRHDLKAAGIERLKVVYSEEAPRVPAGDARTPASISFVPGAAGLLMAGEIIKDLTGVR